MERQIIPEIAAALEDHGAASNVLRKVRQTRALNLEFMAEAYAELERLGAHHWLLGTIGSWRDGMTDAEVLDQLKAINAGTFRFDLIASTSSDAA